MLNNLFHKIVNNFDLREGERGVNPQFLSLRPPTPSDFNLIICESHQIVRLFILFVHRQKQKCLENP